MNQKSTHHDSEHTSNPTRHIILCYNYNTVFVHPSHAYLLALYQRRAMSPENGTPFLYVGDLRRLGKIFFASAMCISIFSHGSWSFHTSACLTGASFAPDYLRVAARQTFWIDKKVTLEMQVFEKKNISIGYEDQKSALTVVAIMITIIIYGINYIFVIHIDKYIKNVDISTYSGNKFITHKIDKI